MRRQLTIVGAVLASQGHITRGDNVFLVDLIEARAGLADRGLRETVARRRATYELELRRQHVPHVLLSDGTEPEAQILAGPEQAHTPKLPPGTFSQPGSSAAGATRLA